jgi:hypothetical protein
MSNDDIFQDYPQQLPAGMEPNAPVYKRLSGFYAVHGWRADRSGVEPVQTLEDGAIAILKGQPDPTAAAADPSAAATDVTKASTAQRKLSPVYSQQSSGAPGSMAVPTGRVFIRFADAIKVADREAQIRNARYELDQKLDYAPNAAWLRARSGNIADALNGIASLRKIADVKNVEPQLLMQVSYR